MDRMKQYDNKQNGWYSISPVEAAQMFETRNRNRPLVEAHAVRIAEAIKTGKFLPNGESIVFDGEGHLLDGQHRIRACVLANKPMEVYCVYLNTRTSAALFDTIDQGKVRTAHDRLALDGVQYAAVAAATTRALWLYEHGTNPAASGKRLVTIETIRKMYARNADEIQHSISVVYPFWKDIRGWMPGSLACFAYLSARRVNPEKAEKWIEALLTGENLTAGSPVLHLRRQLMGETSGTSRRRVANESRVALTIKSWIFFNADERVGVLKWAPGVEEFPKFTDVPSEMTAWRRKQRAAATA